MGKNLDAPVRINLLHMRPAQHEHHSQKSQIPPDLVVKSQAIDIAEIILS
jgi:hypothetical protein